MTMTRAFRRIVGRALIGVILFAQLAIAAHACPGPARTAGSTPQVAAAPGMPGDMTLAGAGDIVEASAGGLSACDQMTGMDPAAPNLCQEHCRQGQQSDQTHALTVPAVLLTGLYFVSTTTAMVVPRVPNAAPVERLAAASPPHAILHCCLRD